MLGYVSKEVDRLKELFRDKEAALIQERDKAVQRLEACQAELAQGRAALQAAASEAAAQLQVHWPPPDPCCYGHGIICWGQNTSFGPHVREQCCRASRHVGLRLGLVTCRSPPSPKQSSNCLTWAL